MSSDTSARAQQPERIRIGISSCLLGQEVRFDGGHKRDSYINGTLQQYFDFVPVCPELAIGLGVPREPIRLVIAQTGTRVIGTRTPGLDVTEALREYGERKGREMRDISGYILKRGSPSCGMERVKVYTPAGMPNKSEPGMYARAFMTVQPLLPIEEEGRLGDPVLRENFITRVFVYHRWQTLLQGGLTPAKLVDFHTRHKLLILAHNQAAYRRMGRLVAGAGAEDLDTLAAAYVHELMTALKRGAGRRHHMNVLQHLLGYLRKQLDAADRAEMHETIGAYGEGLIPLIVPITLLKHHFRRHPHPYVENQYYLSPHPAELMLRNAL
jgi:uncharacterized protein YbgA (DUF1722 family)/uncharacterized protein YbbK (DUF523 family)